MVSKFVVQNAKRRCKDFLFARRSYVIIVQPLPCALRRHGYASMFAYVACSSMNSRRGPTSSPISMEKM